MRDVLCGSVLRGPRLRAVRIGGVALVAGLLGLGLVAGCGQEELSSHPFEATRAPDPSSGAPTSPAPATDAPKSPKNLVMRISDARVTESSGLAASPKHQGVLYTHNDRGNTAEVFAVDRTGTRAVIELDVPATDWEDIATTPDGRVWVADTGDNELRRSTIAVHVFQEPEVLASGRLSSTTYEFSYPDGPRDSEALLVHPETGQIHLVTKDEKSGAVYAAPEQLDPDGVNELTRVGKAPHNVTAGDFSADGSMVVLRNQGKLFFSTELGGATTTVRAPKQRQGESVTFSPDDKHVWVGSEGTESQVLSVPVPDLGG